MDAQVALNMGVAPSESLVLDEPPIVNPNKTPDTIAILPRFWFDTSLNCLQLAGFLEFPTIYALQAICVLPTIAHAFE